jgi:hypothetical protein
VETVMIGDEKRIVTVPITDNTTLRRTLYSG